MPTVRAQKKTAPSTPHNWRTTDTDEIQRRRDRASSEVFRITNLDAKHPIFSNFMVKSPSGMDYSVEIRELSSRQFSCSCVDFRINGLGTCKHVEALLLHLEARHKKVFKAASQGPSNRADLVPDADRGQIRVLQGTKAVPAPFRAWFDRGGFLKSAHARQALDRLAAQGKSVAAAKLRVSQDVRPWLESQLREADRKRLRHEYELKVQSGEWPPQETKVPLFPYQREGMLHLAFVERALLADEMGLGKTIQAIAACALLHRLGSARRVLVVTPASLKTEWEEQIQRFTDLSYQLVFGSRLDRLEAYDRAGRQTLQDIHGSSPSLPFFTIVNYEQMLLDSLDVNRRLKPDVVVLDEAQRIKNWSAKTTQAIKRLQSRYAFVLTGTPIENRIDELHSLMDFLNPTVLGPLFRFNREYYELDERGRPQGYKNLAKLNDRIRPYMLRRRKSEVETELPDRTDRTHLVPMSDEQKSAYADHELVVSRLGNAARKRPLTQPEQEKLLRHLAMMRMVCDTNYILDPEDKTCPKLAELEKILEECRDNQVKVIIFSEWERMLELVRECCVRLGVGFAWHTGSVPQRRRRAEINSFKTDPACSVFLSTDSGAAGLNLQVASVVVNCDLPWNPAKLEQRIARAWRKHQTRPVTVINLVSENTIEQKMLETLANKQALADGVLDRRGDLEAIPMRSGRQAFLARLEQILSTRPITPAGKAGRESVPPPLPVDRSLSFAQRAAQQSNGALLRCEERYPRQGAHSVLYVVVERDSGLWRDRLQGLHASHFGPGNSDALCPVLLEVVDRATDEVLSRLAESGLLTMTVRGSRPLFPAVGESHSAPPLTEKEKAHCVGLREQAGRKLKAARLLFEGGLVQESLPSLNEGLLVLGRALALEQRLGEPVELNDLAAPPFVSSWGALSSAVKTYISTAQISDGRWLAEVASLAGS
jgi:hypothetical protein